MSRFSDGITEFVRFALIQSQVCSDPTKPNPSLQRRRIQRKLKERQMVSSSTIAWSLSGVGLVRSKFDPKNTH
jgi:hypothetical protein